MNAASRKYSQPTLWDTSSATSSQVSGDGVTHSSWRPGPLKNQFGLDRVRANHFQAVAVVVEQTTADIFGLTSSGSSRSANLCMSLGSKLQERLASTGSMGYVQTWKLRTTPLGLQYWEHIAKLSPMSGSDFSGLPTPTVNSILEKECPKQDGW